MIYDNNDMVAADETLGINKGFAVDAKIPFAKNP
jgi:hypothetical protein